MAETIKKLPPAEIAALRKLRGLGMRSAVGEYTPPELWDALDEIERLRTLQSEHGGEAVLSAKSLEWKEESEGWWSDARMGFNVEHNADPDEALENRYTATWGEGDSEHFATLNEAKAWCQEQADGWIRDNGQVTTPPTLCAPGAAFAEWLAIEMPAGTVIGNPTWWADRIARQYAKRCTPMMPTWPKFARDEALEVLRNVDTQFRATGQSSARIERLINLLSGLPVEATQGAAGNLDAPSYGIIDPDYARVFTIARCLAWAEGYALAMHGSFTRDLDLIAVPWTDSACEPEHLARRIEDAAKLRIIVSPSGDKPHGRLAWTLRFDAFGDPRFVDLSVMPNLSRQCEPAAAEGAPQAR